MKKIMFFALIATLLGVVSCQKEFFPTESIVENTKTPDLDPETAKIIGYWTCKATVAENGNTVEYDILFNADGTYYLHLLETRIDGTEHTPTIHLGKFYLEGGKIHFDDCIGIHNTCLNYFFDGDFLVIEDWSGFSFEKYYCTKHEEIDKKFCGRWRAEIMNNYFVIDFRSPGFGMQHEGEINAHRHTCTKYFTYTFDDTTITLKYIVRNGEEKKYNYRIVGKNLYLSSSDGQSDITYTYRERVI